MIESTSDADHTTPHLIRCYGNVQEVLRFLDAKAAVIFTLSGVMLGSLASKQAEWCEWALIPLFSSISFSVIAMMLALRTVWPSHGSTEPEHLTLLFPALNPSAKSKNGRPVDIAALVNSKLKEPLTLEFIRNEYGAQLAFLNKKLVRKISSLRGAIICIIVALLSVLICQFGKKIEKEKTAPIKVVASCDIKGTVSLTAPASLTKDASPVDRATHAVGEDPSGKD